MGTIPTMVLVALDWGLDPVVAFGLGTGASQLDDGRFEAEVMRDLFVARADDLLEFDRIRNHPVLESSEARDRLTHLIRNTFVDTASRNTAQEIERAAWHFESCEVSTVSHVTCASHVSRCAREVTRARKNEHSPAANQLWMSVADDMFYDGTDADGVVVFEPPHRQDDPMRDAPIKPNEVFRRFFRLPGADAKQNVLGEVDTIMTSYGV